MASSYYLLSLWRVDEGNCYIHLSVLRIFRTTDRQRNTFLSSCSGHLAVIFISKPVSCDGTVNSEINKTGSRNNICMARGNFWFGIVTIILIRSPKPGCKTLGFYLGFTYKLFNWNKRMLWWLIIGGKHYLQTTIHWLLHRLFLVQYLWLRRYLRTSEIPMFFWTKFFGSVNEKYKSGSKYKIFA